MRQGKRRALALLCALLMSVSLLGATAYATADIGGASGDTKTDTAASDTSADSKTDDAADKKDDTKTGAADATKTDTKTDAKDDTEDDDQPDVEVDEDEDEVEEPASKGEADALRKEYQDLQAQINSKREEMNDLKSELDKIKSDKASTQQQKSLLDQRNSALTGEITLLEQQIDIINRSIAANETLEKQQTERFHRQIRLEEEQGTMSYWSVLFKANSFSDLISRIDFINEIARYNKQVISDLREIREGLAEDQAALEAQNEVLSASKQELQGQLSQSMQLLAEYVKTEEGKQAEYDAIKAEEEALDDLIAVAEAKARELGMEDIAGTVGGYAWPCSGIRWITSMFGGRESPGGIGSTNHKGVDIGTPMGTPILAAKSGTVTWASWNGGYGNCVIISHGKGNSTLYGHLSGYNVSVGDTVTQGQVIAYSGSTGNSTGPHLHFGVMENETWVDPLNYLTGWQYYG